jgi:sodium/potassium-transporting ATPase subunit alpha
MLPSQVIVLRHGSSSSIPAADLVPGDVVEIRAGNKIPADLRLCQVSSDLKFDRSVLTGESNPIRGSVNFTDDNFLEVTPFWSF